MVPEKALAMRDKEPLVTAESAAFLSASLLCRSDKAIRELGYRVVPLRTMLDDCYQWMVAEGLLPAAASLS